MAKGKKVVIVGLPKFASKLTARLKSYCPEANIRCFDTYYNSKDKLLSIPHILATDVVYSINGSITKSRVFDLAIKFNKKLIMHWVGTDVIKALKAYRSGNFNQEYIDYAIHFCEVEWMKDELKEMGITAEIQNFVGFKASEEIPKIPDSFNVLSYLHPNREEFYGIEKLIACANKFPEIPFYIAGSEGYSKKTPENITFFGWVNNLHEMIQNAGLCVRIPEHDGLSSFVLESLSEGKHVAYTYEFPHCIQCKSAEELCEIIEKKKKEFDSGKFEVNSGAVKFIQKEFNEQKIFDNLLEQFGIWCEKN